MTGMINNSRTKAVDGRLKFFFLLSIAMLLPAKWGFASTETNKMVSMQMSSSKGSSALTIVTENPIGYRYTVYDSDDQAHVVINFPHMDIEAVSSLIEVNRPPVQKVEVSSHETSWGRLARVDVVLSQGADYDVVIHNNELVLTLLPHADQRQIAAVHPVLNETVPVAAPASKPAEESKRAPVVVPEPALVSAAPASAIQSVDVGEQIVTLRADGRVENYKFFSLDGPERLVVDVYGVKPGFEERSFLLSDDYSRIRVGVYKEKLRFVFDVSDTPPRHTVTGNGQSVVIRWDSGR